MTARRRLVGRIYVPELTHDDSIRLLTVEAPLPDAEVVAGQLVAPAVSVECRVVLVAAGAAGELEGVPMEPLRALDDRLCFDPSDGGVRMRANRGARGAFNEQVAEAARFGMVNVLHHLSDAARRVNRLLSEVGAAPLPPVHAVVGAHSGSQLPGYGCDDADYRRGTRHPLQGGHYRVSQRTTGIREPLPVRPSGEIHFGPGRHREPFAGRPSYLRNAAHNPATIYHEYGHHLCRHTADFRLNDERPPAKQRNGKTGPEEGVCDVLAAALLGTGRPYGWQRSERGAQRDPEIRRPPVGEDADPHEVGARWSTTFWLTRQALVARGLLPSALDHDRALLHALVEIGRVAREQDDPRPRGERALVRRAPETIAHLYVEALRDAGGAPAAAIAEQNLLAHALAAAEVPAC
jgi:hypothetical protein